VNFYQAFFLAPFAEGHWCEFGGLADLKKKTELYLYSDVLHYSSVISLWAVWLNKNPPFFFSPPNPQTNRNSSWEKRQQASIWHLLGS